MHRIASPAVRELSEIFQGAFTPRGEHLDACSQMFWFRYSSSTWGWQDAEEEGEGVGGQGGGRRRRKDIAEEEEEEREEEEEEDEEEKEEEEEEDKEEEDPPTPARHRPQAGHPRAG